MDIKDFLRSGLNVAGNKVALSGWLVDKDTGLFLLGDHSPENYDHDCMIKISNPNIMHQILRSVPSLGGGRSLLFYRVNITGILNDIGEIKVDKIEIEYDRESNEFHLIDISERAVDERVKELGDYNFKKQSTSIGDWLDDLD